GGFSGKASGSAKIGNCFAGGEITASGNPDFTDGYGKPAKLAVGGVVGGIDGVYSAGAQSCISSVDLGVDGTGVDVHCAGIIAEIKTQDEKRVANCLYAGEIVVNADPDYQTNMGAILGKAEALYTVENCYYASQAPVIDWTLNGGAEADGSDYLSANWQRNNLALDESVWEITDGLLPKIKNL
ncbi:MAG: hypothetical protein K2N22_05595, partial [Clostridia bacterium]|nr:hypothetical protein [Clostridia bacterium]